MAHAVQQGQSLTAAMKHCGLFAPVVIQLCAMGEASGQLSATLSRSAGLEERALETQLQGLSGLIEPVIILVLGVLIGTTVLGLVTIPLWIKLGLWILKPKNADMRVPLMGVLKRLQSSRMASQLAFMMIEFIRRDAITKFGGKRGE